MLTRKFSRRIDHRESLMRNLATSLVLYERVTTTTAKAKEIRGLVERLINVGKDNSLSSYRRLRSFYFDPNAAKKTIEELGPRYKHLTGGYVVTTPLVPRKSDSAPMSLLELRGVSAQEKEREAARKEEKVTEKPKAQRVTKAVKRPVKPTKRAAVKKSVTRKTSAKRNR